MKYVCEKEKKVVCMKVSASKDKSLKKWNKSMNWITCQCINFTKVYNMNLIKTKWTCHYII